MNISFKVYTSKACVQCNATKRSMKKYKFSYEEINLDEMSKEEEAKTRSYLQGLGYMALPVVIMIEGDEEKESWSGFRPDKFKALAKANALVPA